MLKHITDTVRDSLDESQILQTVVQEIGQGLGVDCCDTALYDLDQGLSTICYEYTTLSIPPVQGSVVQLQSPFHGVHAQLLQGQCLQFCENAESPIRPIQGCVTLLACPLFDDQGILGDLWLLKCGENHLFNELEVRLVQQVANQCAIALRQARLYQTAQAQVIALEKLHQLKDDFLSTVSHELRTPMANIKMREVNLINDLLDLARLDADVEPLVLTTIQPQVWLLCIAKPFMERAQSQQQRLRLNVDLELPLLETDVTYLERILSELLQNACKYTPSGETITLMAHATQATLQISVSNAGVELAEGERSRIFDRFYRIAGNDRWRHGGTGLGLALVQKLVTQLGGTIDVASAAGQVTFTVQLPLKASTD